MIRLATVFSGIGAIEHALQRMQIKNEIIFACDNGDVSILTKKIDMNIDEIGEAIMTAMDKDYAQPELMCYMNENYFTQFI